MNLTKNITLLTLLLTLVLLKVNAQDREVGLLLGVTEYQGDLSKKQATFSETKPGLGISYRYYFNPRLDVKGQANFGWISGDDKNYPDVDGWKDRNLSFKSHVYELSGQLELNLLPFISNSKKYRFAPYIFGGLAVFHMNPTAEYQGTKYDLQPLGTEGQYIPGSAIKPYKKIQIGIPYGLGIKYSIGNFWNIGIELGQRKLFFDYLDDVSSEYPNFDQLKQTPNGDMAFKLSDRGVESVGKPHIAGEQRGDPKDFDMYDFMGITISKTIRRFSCTNF